VSEGGMSWKSEGLALAGTACSGSEAAAVFGARAAANGSTGAPDHAESHNTSSGAQRHHAQTIPRNDQGPSPAWALYPHHEP